MRVLYPGGFDLLHHGHVNALNTARSIAGPDGTLTVGVNTDRLMVAYKRRPHDTEDERVRSVTRLGIPPQVILWDGPDGQGEQILAAEPDLYIAGTDWLSKDLAHQLRVPTLEWFDTNNISLLYLRRTQGLSTTQLTEQLKRASSGSC